MESAKNCDSKKVNIFFHDNVYFIDEFLNYVVYRSASLDVEPLYTFRSHTGPVFCLAISKNGEHCYSGGLDNVIKVWSMPSANIDPYDSYGIILIIFL